MSEEHHKMGGDDDAKEIERSRVEAEHELEDRRGLEHLVSELKSMEQQVGEHVIQALQHDNTVAVLTAVLSSDGGGGQRIASVPLDMELWQQVQELLVHVGEERSKDVPCVGFQCVLEQRRLEEQAQEKPEEGAPPDNF